MRLDAEKFLYLDSVLTFKFENLILNEKDSLVPRQLIQFEIRLD